MNQFLSKMFQLKNKVAVVIGGGGYLCSQMALALARSGADIAILDRNEKTMTQIAKVIRRKTGVKVMTFVIDVTRKEYHEMALRAILAELGRVDILINGAGINAPTPFFKITEEEWTAILDSHVKATFLGCQVFGEYMVKRKRGCIINLSSVSSGPPLPKAFSYSVAKAGVKNLTENLAREWAPFNVRVNALRPGFFPTEWSMRNFITPDRQRAILNHTPMGRFGKPEELVSTVIWLCSDASGFVTGAEVPVDGGFTCMSI